VNEGAPDLLIDGTERRRQRPKNAKKQEEYYSGKKKAHTDKNTRELCFGIKAGQATA
jgi:hypothetical protein